MTTDPEDGGPPQTDREAGDGRPAVEHQGNVMFWVTLSVGALILVLCVVFALIR